MSKLTGIFLSLSHLRKVQLQFKEKCNLVQLHIFCRKVQLYFLNRKVQLKYFFCKWLRLKKFSVNLDIAKPLKNETYNYYFRVFQDKGLPGTRGPMSLLSHSLSYHKSFCQGIAMCTHCPPTLRVKTHKDYGYQIQIYPWVCKWENIIPIG
jgi:hypothetical protein